MFLVVKIFIFSEHRKQLDELKYLYFMVWKFICFFFFSFCCNFIQINAAILARTQRDDVLQRDRIIIQNIQCKLRVMLGWLRVCYKYIKPLKNKFVSHVIKFLNYLENNTHS